MRKLLILTIIAFINLTAFTQNSDEDRGRYNSNDEIRTLAGNRKHSNGGYGAFGAGYSSIDGKDGMTMTGRGACILGHSFAIGLAGTGFINNFSTTPDPDRMVNLSGGYGGLLMEPILLPKFPIHLSFPVIAGVGGISYISSYRYVNSWEYYDATIEDTKTYLIAEPGVELEMNVLKFFRLAFGVSYRFTSDIDWNYSTPDVLEGWTAGMTFKFGKF